MTKQLKILYNLSLRNEKRLTSIIQKLGNSKFFMRILLERQYSLYSKIGIDLFCLPLDVFPIWMKDGFIDENGRKFRIYKDEDYNIDMLYSNGNFFDNYEEYRNFPNTDYNHPIKENLVKMSREMSKKYSVFTAYGISGLFESIWQGFGLTNFSKMLRKNKEILRSIIDDKYSYNKSLIENIVEWNNYEEGVIFISADYGFKNGLITGSQFFRDEIFPKIKKLVDLSHKGNLKFIMHSCGDNLPIFDDIVKTGVDAIHPIEPTTSNPEYDIFKLHEKYGDKITFIGNVSPQDLAMKNGNHIYDYTKKLLTKLSPNIILSSGHSINPSVRLGNFLAMRKALNDYNKNGKLS